jgi:hypothetical protein
MADASDKIASIALPDGGEIRVSLQATKDGLAVDVRAFQTFTPAQVRMPSNAALTVPLVAVGDVVLALETALATAVERAGVRP